MTLYRLFSIIIKYKVFIFISIAGGVFFSLLFSMLQPDIYEATATVMLKHGGELTDATVKIMPFHYQPTDINNQIVLLKSQTLMQQLVERLEQSEYNEKIQLLKHPLLRHNIFWNRHQSYNKLARIREFQENVCSVHAIINTDLIELRVRALNPHHAAFIANTWVEVYQKNNIDFNRQGVSEIKQFLQNQLFQTEQALFQSEDTLKLYKEREHVAEISEETHQMIDQIAAFDVKYGEACIELESVEMRLAHLREKLNESQQMLLNSSLASPVVESLQNQLGQLMAEKAAYEEQLKSADFYTEEDSKLQNLSSRLNGIQQKLEDETKAMIQQGVASMDPRDLGENITNEISVYEAERIALKVKVDALGRIVSKYNRQVEKLPKKDLELARLERETKVNNNLFLMLRQKVDESRITEAGQVGSVRIVDKAVPDLEPILPRTGLNIVLGFIIGLCMGIGFSVLLDAKDVSIKEPEDLEQMNVPVIGTIPRLQLSSVSKVIEFPFLESYRMIRTQLLFDKSCKSLLVSSPSIGEGKSTTVTNLAVVFSLLGLRTLIIDGDLRKPVQHDRLQMSNQIGLSTALESGEDVFSMVKKTAVPNLWLLPAGPIPSSPAELIWSKQISKIFRQMEEQFDILVIDSPPVLAVTDATILMQQTEQSLLVIKSGITSMNHLSRCLPIIESKSRHFAGVVLNEISVKKEDEYYMTYYQKSVEVENVS